MEKLSRKTIRRVRDLMLATGFVLVCAALSRIPLLIGLTAILGLFTALQAHRIYRCPHCGAALQYVSPAGEDAGDCPKCGERIKFDD